MCSEAVPWRCHRSLIADALVVRGVTVEHILGVTHTRPHVLHSWARVQGDRITYPAPEAGAVGGDVQESTAMPSDFKVGDHVEWNSEAGRVRGTILKKITTEIEFKGYTVHASEEEPQYLIQSDKTDHRAMHKGSALKRIRKSRS